MPINFARRKYTCFEEDPELRRQLADQLRKQSFVRQNQESAEADCAKRRRELRRRLQSRYPSREQQGPDQQLAATPLGRVRTQDLDGVFLCLTCDPAFTPSSSFGCLDDALDMIHDESGNDPRALSSTTKATTTATTTTTTTKNNKAMNSGTFHDMLSPVDELLESLGLV